MNVCFGSIFYIQKKHLNINSSSCKLNQIILSSMLINIWDRFCMSSQHLFINNHGTLIVSRLQTNNSEALLWKSYVPPKVQRGMSDSE